MSGAACLFVSLFDFGFWVTGVLRFVVCFWVLLLLLVLRFFRLVVVRVLGLLFLRMRWGARFVGVLTCGFE